jgi:hypothetical protein
MSLLLRVVALVLFILAVVLWHDSMRRMWRGTIENKGIDFVASIDTIAYDNLLACESMSFDLDLGRDLWLNRQRWTRLVRQYLDPVRDRTIS